MALCYRKATIKDIEILAETRIEVLRAGGISYFQVMPTHHNPTGKKLLL